MRPVKALFYHRQTAHFTQSANKKHNATATIIDDKTILNKSENALPIIGKAVSITIG